MDNLENLSKSKDDPEKEQMLDSIIDMYGYEEAIQALAFSAGYESVPPTIEEFMDDEYFLGSILVNDDGESTVYPIWREALKEIYPDPFYSPYLQVVLTGAIGLGKSHVCKIGIAYDICKMLHLKNPHRHYGVGVGKKLTFALINKTKQLTGDVLMGELLSWFGSSPYFKKQLAAAPRKGSLFPKDIDIVLGSRGQHVLGHDVVSAVLSELNDQNTVENQAYDNYTNAIRRLTSRFDRAFRKYGSYPGRIWLDSSTKDTASFIDQALPRLNADPMARVFSYAAWEAKAHMKDLYPSGEKFQVFIGSESRDPFIVEETSWLPGKDKDKIIEVPIEERHQFEENIFESLRDLAGISIGQNYVFIASPSKIKESLVLTNPIGKAVIALDLYDQKDRLVDYVHGLEILNKDRRPRFLHFDIGLKQDRTGIAATRLDGFKEYTRYNEETEREEIVRDPIFKTEWVMCVECKPGQEVSITKLKNLVVDLREREYPIAQVTCDGYESRNMIQDLNVLNGIDAEVLSVDRTKDAYYNLKAALMEGRWTGPDHFILQRELKELEDGSDKVDHPMIIGNKPKNERASKDLADACAGSTYAAFLGIKTYSANNSIDEFFDAWDEVEGAPVTLYDRIKQGFF